MPFRRTTSRVARPHRPNRSWSGFASTAGTGVAASTKVLLGGFTLSNPNIDETVLRTVGTFMCLSDQSAADELQIGAIGMMIVTDLAVAAGAASIPGPITDRGDDGWFVYIPLVQSLDVNSAIGVEPQFATQYHFDSKAKRRAQEGQQVVIMVENASASFGFIVAGVFRMLSQVSGT